MIQSFAFLLLATTMETFGDAIVRIGIYRHAGIARLGLYLGGACLLFGYGYCLNRAPVDFGRVVGLYIATLFMVWQIVNFITFRAAPSMPTLVGGAFIITGGLIVTFWKSPLSN